jgi:hypothetical protein
MGARFSNGTFGYITDVTRVRELMLERYQQEANITATTLFSWLPMSKPERVIICQHPPASMVLEGEGGWKILTKKVVVDGPNPSQPNSKMPPIKTRSKGKILCAVYIHEGNHGHLESIKETWGWRCDGFFAASNKTVDDTSDPGFGAIDLPHKGNEGYENMWQKTRSILSYMHDHYLDEYEYFYLCGDDTYLIVENLRNYLGYVEQIRRDKYEPLHLGHLVRVNMSHLGQTVTFVGGGGGYVLNREALQRLVRESIPKCFPDDATSMEDVYVSMCLQELGIEPYDAVDELEEQLFQVRPPHDLATYNGTDGSFHDVIYKFWAERHGFKSGVDIVSAQSVSFHHLIGATMKRTHAILYQSCQRGTVLGDAMADL